MTKCVCGYYYLHSWEKDKESLDYLGFTDHVKALEEQGREPFIHIQGTFLVENTGYHGGEHRVSLFACPECGTVKMID